MDDEPLDLADFFDAPDSFRMATTMDDIMVDTTVQAPLSSSVNQEDVNPNHEPTSSDQELSVEEAPKNHSPEGVDKDDELFSLAQPFTAVDSFLMLTTTNEMIVEPTAEAPSSSSGNQEHVSPNHEPMTSDLEFADGEAPQDHSPEGVDRGEPLGLTELATAADSFPMIRTMDEIIAEPVHAPLSSSGNHEHVNPNHEPTSSNLEFAVGEAPENASPSQLNLPERATAIQIQDAPQQPVVMTDSILPNPPVEAPPLPPLPPKPPSSSLGRRKHIRDVSLQQPTPSLKSSIPGFQPGQLFIWTNSILRNPPSLELGPGLQQSPVGNPSLGAPSSGNQVHRRVFGSSVVSPDQQLLSSNISHLQPDLDVQGGHIPQAREEAKATYSAKKVNLNVGKKII